MDAVGFTLEDSGYADDNTQTLDEFFSVRNNTSYRLILRAEEQVWRLGLKFYNHHQKPFENEKYIVIHMGDDGDDHAVSNGVELRHAGFQDGVVVWYSLDFVEAREPVELFIHPVTSKGGLYISFTAPDKSFGDTFIKTPATATYFQVEAWSEGQTFCVHGTIEKYDAAEIAQMLNPFQVENIRFRMGDLFDRNIIDSSDLTLLPVSTNGTAVNSINSEARVLGLPYPIPQGTPGQVFVYKSSNGKFAGYAYSVNSHSRDPELLNELFKNINEQASLLENVSHVNIPLLGTGAGQVPLLRAVDIMDKEFNQRKSQLSITVSVLSAEQFLKVKSHFIDRYFPLPAEELPSKPIELGNLEFLLNIQLKPSDFRLDVEGNVTYLNLSHHSLFTTAAITKFAHLKELNISHTANVDLRFLSELTSLESLIASNIKIEKNTFLELKNLKSLDLSNCNISSLEILTGFSSLERLTLKSNRIKDISPIASLTGLIYLDISGNKITNTEPLKGLTKLASLNLAYNELESLEDVLNITSLATLDVANNNLYDIPEILQLQNLIFVKADGNPFQNFVKIYLDEKGNHFITLRNFLLRQQEKNKVKIILPVKVLLLGNHGSGKSSLLRFLQTQQLSDAEDSTHLIKIEKFPPNVKGLPKAIFFDFGGQDYYHGLYRAFLSGGAVYVLLWREQNNENKLTIDSNDLFIRNFSLDYWLWQKQYLEKQKFYNDESSPVILVQTYASKEKKSYPSDMDIHNIHGDVFVELTNGKLKGTSKTTNLSGLNYLRSMITEIIEKKSIVRTEPQWFVEFINYIVKQNSIVDHKSVTVVDLLPHYSKNATLTEFEAELEQLHKQGLILYYSDAIPDRVWLNPVALVKYIHDHILNKSILKTDKPGIISFDELDGIVKDPHIIELLVQQKVLFRHTQNSTYIIPNFLLLSESDDQLSLLTFGLQKPLFVLKFENFLPFGLINQIICYFGILPDKKIFWRDQLIFTIDKSTKILIKIDFSNLEIHVYATFDSSVDSTAKEIIERYLFYGIMGLYWDLPMLSYQDFKRLHLQEIVLSELDPNDSLFLPVLNANDLHEDANCRPGDMFVSVNGKDYIRYTELCENSSHTMIHCLTIDDEGVLKDEGRVIPIYQFQPFTNAELKKPLKAVISYSKRDIKLVNKFRQYLVPLADDGLMENPWYCSELIAGEPWDDVIQGKFDKADIIFFMISENLMSTQYVKDHEIKNAIDKWNKYQNIKIVPIVLTPYHWARTGTYNLADFTALPYTGLAVTMFPNQNLAWNYISEGIRIMIEQKLYPGSAAFTANFEMEQFFEKVMRFRDQHSL